MRQMRAEQARTRTATSTPLLRGKSTVGAFSEDDPGFRYEVQWVFAGDGKLGMTFRSDKDDQGTGLMILDKIKPAGGAGN